jgi:hypothetical protein
VLRALGADGRELGEAGRLVRADPGESVPGSGDAAADARFRLFDAVATGLVGLADPGPVLVVLDDLQWADEPSLRLLDFVVRQVGNCRLLILGAYRDDEAGPTVRALSEIGRLLPVGGIGPADVPALMAAVAGPAATSLPSARLAERIWRRSGGNPFLVGELTRLLLSRGGGLVRTSGTFRSPTASATPSTGGSRGCRSRARGRSRSRHWSGPSCVPRS